MKKRYSYEDCYKILDIDPAISWDELRRAYKQQIQKWHPDKFVGNAVEHEAANDKIKRVTTAHQQLVAYYRRHGKLPLPESQVAPVRLPAREPFKPTQTQSSQTKKPHTPSRRRQFGLFPVVTFVVILASLFWYYSPDSGQTHPFSQERRSRDLTEPKIDNRLPPAPLGQIKSEDDIQADKKTVDEKFITYGSSIGEVITIQGPPTRDEGNVWYYDDSELYFEKGVVIGWKHMPGSRLKTRVPQQPKLNRHALDIQRAP